jgi:uncharacterized protein YodC (DUF2158 family)
MKKKTKFRPGDRVTSLGTDCRMTVREYKGGQVVCDWWEDEGGNYNKPHRESFDEKDLQFCDISKRTKFRRKVTT